MESVPRNSPAGLGNSPAYRRVAGRHGDHLPRTRRSRDGSWAKKGSKFSLGFKLHAKTDVDLSLIRELETTPANVLDSRVDFVGGG